jgi:hypothetical protein
MARRSAFADESSENRYEKVHEKQVFWASSHISLCVPQRHCASLPSPSPLRCICRQQTAPIDVPSARELFAWRPRSPSMQFLGSLIGRGRDSAAQLPPVTAKKLVAEMPADEARDSRWSGVGQVDDGDWDDDECGSQGGEAGSPHGSPPGSPSAQRGGRSVDVARAAVNDDDDDDGDGGNGPILGGLGAATRPVRQEGCAPPACLRYGTRPRGGRRRQRR